MMQVFLNASLRRPRDFRAGLRAIAAIAALCLSGLLPASAAYAADADEDWPESATEEDVLAARSVLMEWGAAYQSGDYDKQWRLTDKRIRRWIDLKRWRRGMRAARGRDGALGRFEILNGAAISAEQLPCTEQGHCFRQNVHYVIFLIESHYAIAAPPQPEYVAMALSDEGWRFGGGTFPNRPLGETAVIMTPSDERRYKFKGVDVQQ